MDTAIQFHPTLFVDIEPLQSQIDRLIANRLTNIKEIQESQKESSDGYTSTKEHCEQLIDDEYRSLATDVYSLIGER